MDELYGGGILYTLVMSSFSLHPSYYLLVNLYILYKFTNLRECSILPLFRRKRNNTYSILRVHCKLYELAFRYVILLQYDFSVLCIINFLFVSLNTMGIRDIGTYKELLNLSMGTCVRSQMDRRVIPVHANPIIQT